MTKREFDDLPTGTMARRFELRRASASELAAMQPRIADALRLPIATPETTERIRQRHADNTWSILARRTARPIGLYAMVMLSVAGQDAVLAGAFDQRDPDPSHTAPTGDPVAAIYKWTIFAPGSAVGAVPLMAEFLRGPAYARADLYGTGASQPGRRLMEHLGFEPIPLGANSRETVVYRYVRRANRREF